MHDASDVSNSDPEIWDDPPIVETKPGSARVCFWGYGDHIGFQPELRLREYLFNDLFVYKECPMNQDNVFSLHRNIAFGAT
jgi:hypothetical protein